MHETSTARVVLSPPAAPRKASPASTSGLVAVLELVELEDALEEIDRLGESVSPLLADYALTLDAVVPLRHRHDRIPWLPVEGTASDGRDGARLRAAALGSSSALDVALDATALADPVLRTAMARALRTAASWGHADERGGTERLARFGRYFDPLVDRLGDAEEAARGPEECLVRGSRDVVHGALAGARALASPGNSNAATIAISSFARAVHHAAGAARVHDEEVLDRVCAGAVHGLVAMAAVA